MEDWEFPEAETWRYAELMQWFEGVSVRGDTGVRLCLDYLKVKAEHVLDPMMLLSAADYRALVREWLRRGRHPTRVDKHLAQRLAGRRVAILLSAMGVLPGS